MILRTGNVMENDWEIMFNGLRVRHCNPEIPALFGLKTINMHYRILDLEGKIIKDGIIISQMRKGEAFAEPFLCARHWVGIISMFLLNPHESPFFSCAGFSKFLDEELRV